MPSGIANTGVSHRFKDRTGDRNGRLLFTKYLGVNEHRHGIWKPNATVERSPPPPGHTKPGRTDACKGKLRPKRKRPRLFRKMNEIVA